MVERQPLFVVQRALRLARLGYQGMEAARAVSDKADDFPLAQQDLAQGHIMRAILLSDVGPPTSLVLQLAKRELFPSYPTQRLLPDLAFHDDGLAVE